MCIRDRISHLIKCFFPKFQCRRKPLKTYIVYVAPILPTTPLEQVQYCTCHAADASRKNQPVNCSVVILRGDHEIPSIQKLLAISCGSTTISTKMAALKQQKTQGKSTFSLFGPNKPTHVPIICRKWFLPSHLFGAVPT